MASKQAIILGHLNSILKCCLKGLVTLTCDDTETEAYNAACNKEGVVVWHERTEDPKYCYNILANNDQQTPSCDGFSLGYIKSKPCNG